MGLLRSGLFAAALGSGLAGFCWNAGATTITCCDTSSDATPASQLQLVLDFAVLGNTLALTATNASTQFHVNQLYFNASDDVTALALSSATHSAAGDVTSRWSVLADESAGGLGTFDFELDGGSGANRPWILGPSESVVFVFAISGSGPFSMDDFGVMNADGFQVGAKFSGGPADPEKPGSEDSAFGTIPEPRLLALLVLVLVAGFARSRR